jgi:hypothetical protein
VCVCAVYIHEIQLLCAWQRCCCFLSYFFFISKKILCQNFATLFPVSWFLFFFFIFLKIYFLAFLAFSYSFHPSFFVRAAPSCRTSRFLSLSLSPFILFPIRCKENITQPWLVQFDSISSKKWPSIDPDEIHELAYSALFHGRYRNKAKGKNINQKGKKGLGRTIDRIFRHFATPSRHFSVSF